MLLKIEFGINSVSIKVTPPWGASVLIHGSTPKRH